MDPTASETTGAHAGNSALPTGGDLLLYDNDCPFCSAYVRLARLREVGVALQILGARDHPGLVRAFREQGLDVNDGMILRLAGNVYFGGDVIHVLALMSTPRRWTNRAWSAVFSSQTVARALYPALRAGRNAALRVLGRPPIG